MKLYHIFRVYVHETPAILARFEQLKRDFFRSFIEEYFSTRRNEHCLRDSDQVNVPCFADQYNSRRDVFQKKIYAERKYDKILTEKEIELGEG